VTAITTAHLSDRGTPVHIDTPVTQRHTCHGSLSAAFYQCRPSGLWNTGPWTSAFLQAENWLFPRAVWQSTTTTPTETMTYYHHHTKPHLRTWGPSMACVCVTTTQPVMVWIETWDSMDTETAVYDESENDAVKQDTKSWGRFTASQQRISLGHSMVRMSVCVRVCHYNNHWSTDISQCITNVWIQQFWLKVD